MEKTRVGWEDVKDSYDSERLSVSDGTNFIEVYDNALPPESCSRLIEFFEEYDARGLCRQGSTSTHTDTTLKDSSDLIIDQSFMDSPANAEFQKALTPVFQCLSYHCVKYLMKYHPLLPMAMHGPNNRMILHGDLKRDFDMAARSMQSALSLQQLQIQRYKPPGSGLSRLAL